MGDDLEKKVKEFEARLKEIYMEDCHWNNSHDLNIQFPFSKEILNEPILHQFKMISVDPYDGSTNLVDHLKEYKALMQLHGTSNALLCLVFLMTLKKVAKVWFSSLPPRSFTLSNN